MYLTIDQQVELDEAFVPHARRLRIGKSNFRLRSDITSKESTLQLVYDVLRLTPFYKAFLVTTDVPKIYMQGFWATATVHHHSICFKMNNKKRIVILKYFREMLHICPRLLNQTFNEFLFEEEILAFLRYLGHSAEIRKLTDGMYHKKNVDFAYLLWEDFVYQVEHKEAKKSNEMYYPRFTKVIIHFFMTKDPSIPRRNKIGAILPIELTNEDIRNSAAYKEYYVVASGAAPPKTKVSVRKTQSSSDTAITPPTATSTRLSTSVKGKQPAKSTKAKGLFVLSEIGLHPKFSIHEEEAKDEESFDPIVQTPKKSDDEGNDDASLGMNVGGKEGHDAEDDDEELYRDVNINLVGIDSLFESTPRMDVQASTTVASLTMTTPTLPPLTIPTISQVPQAPTPPTTAPIQLQSDRLRDEAQAENEDFINKLDENIQKIIKEQVKVQVSKILPKIKKTVNEQLEAKVLNQSSKTSYVVAADLSELKLKKILIEKMESNKSIHRSDEQRNLYKAMVDAYECDKLILDTYGDTVTLKRRCDDADKDEEPSVGSDRGGANADNSSLEEPSHQEFKTVAADDQPIVEASQHPEWFQKQKIPPTPDHTLTPELLAGPTYELIKGSCKSLVELEFFLEEFYKATTDQLDWNNPKGQQYPHNLLKPLPLIPNSRGHRVIPFDYFINNDLDYLRGGASGHKYTTSITKTKVADYRQIKWIEYLVLRIMWSQEPVSYDKYALWKISHWGPKRQQFYGFTVNSESARDVYSKRRIIAVTKLQIVEWHDYKHLDWITVRRDDDKLYKFKEGDFKRLRIQDIKDMLLLMAEGKLTNLTVEERFAFNVSLRMFKRSIVIQRRVEDLQLGVESYQKKLNLTKLDTYPSDLKRKEAYTAYSNPIRFIY
uniref:Uncharacterized protein n=1 Tax=Tanacetum cinerariifolium TaxID=118510 RepID=A0A6L2MBH5_TANCI|nr:hypothetical protein [Tanacetum cinerariifolium]